MKKNKISKNWIRKQHHDIFVKNSKLSGYRSRAVYKLKEIDKKFNLFSKNSSVIDLGSAPGSWSQYLSERITQGKIISIDVKKIKKIEGVNFIEGDFTNQNNQEKIKEYFDNKIDIVISDMAANTTGNKTLDANNTGELCIEAMFFAKSMLSKNGHFVSKFFMGSAAKEILSSAKKNFKIVKVFKPSASRSESKENFIICKDPK